MNGNDTVQLVDYLRAIRRRWWLVALLAIVTTAAALAVSLSAEKQYDATAAVLLENEEPVNSLLTPGANFSPADPERQLNTDVELIEAADTAFAAKRLLAKRLLAIDRSVDALLEQVETDVSSTSDIVDITARDTEPLVAARIANAFAEAYVASRAESARERYIEAAQLAERQLQSLSEEELASPEGRELQARQRELEIAAALQTAGAQIVRRASVPETPARPRPMLSGALGLGLGLLLGIAAALARELFDRRLKSEEAVESFFELPILASIPRPSRRGDDHAQREAYGLLAANLRFTSLNRESNVVMVTSASPGEGKTTVTLGLGRALARLGLRVIAIEADLRRPTFSAWAPVGSRRGLSGVLTGSGLARELVWLDVETLEPVRAEATDGSAFAVLPAGELPENPQHVLAQPTMQAVIQGCRAIADVVVIDTPPIGTVNDPATLARHVDAIALVVRLDQTTKDAARRAQRVLSNADVDLPGIVLTGAGGTQGYGYYGPAAPAKSTPSRLNAEPLEALEGTGRSRPEGEHLPRLEGRRR
jgi:capsular exopolysaccharide synthesis family protein